MPIFNTRLQREIRQDVPKEEEVNHYTDRASPFYIRNPSLVGKGILDSSLFGPPFRDSGEKTRCKICDTLAMEPTVCPKKGVRSIPNFGVNSHCKEGSNLIWHMNWKISPWVIWFCFL